jgi:hypothetical protein
LIILTIWSQAFCHGFGNSFPNFVTGGLGRGVTFVAAIACSGLILTMLYLDRNVDIEYSVPYAVTCSLALNAAVLGASYIMAIFYRFDSWLDSAFGVSSTLVSQIALSIFGSVLLFIISIVSKRITTVRDEAIFTLPGFFAVEMFQCMLFADVHVDHLDFLLILLLQVAHLLLSRPTSRIPP